MNIRTGLVRCSSNNIDVCDTNNFFHLHATECDPKVLGSNPSSQQSAGSVSVNNGEIVYDGVTPGSTAHLVCNKGYAASEETRDRTCLCNGVWSGNAQICEEIGKLLFKHDYNLSYCVGVR